MITICFKQKTVFIPLLLVLPLILTMEVIAFIPMTVYALVKKKFILLKVAYSFYFSRFIIALILYGRRLRIITGEIAITGEYMSQILNFR